MSGSFKSEVLYPIRFASSGLERVVLGFAFHVNRERLERLAAKYPDRKLVAALGAEGLVDEKLLFRYIESAHKIPSVDLRAPGVCDSNEIFRLRSGLPADFVFLNRCIPLRKKDGAVTAAFADPFDFDAIKELEYLLHAPVRMVVASEGDIINALSGSIAGISIGADTPSLHDNEIVENADPLPLDLDDTFSGPIIQLVDDILQEAARLESSDIHLEPSTRGFEVRLRIDGVLVIRRVIPKELQAQVTSRLKVMSNMDIAERRRPQDGRFTYKSANTSVDIRSSTVPTPNGEKMVLRLLGGTEKKYKIEALGWSDSLRSNMDELLNHTDGIILVTGPTGSGKTTTLYSCLSHLRQSGRHIVTVEDPIECRLSGITQIQIDTKINMTFAAGLRSILRQDPDIILVGEIRDLETAKTAFNAAQTGHLVLSTLHTKDAVSAVSRLLDLGLEPFVIASCLRGVLAQRLARVNCPTCSRPYTPEESAQLPVGVDASALRMGAGCTECAGSGFRGRAGLYSLLKVAGDVKVAIRENESEATIAEAAAAHGYETLSDAGRALVNKGITTIPEIERVLGSLESIDDAAPALASATAPLPPASAAPSISMSAVTAGAATSGPSRQPIPPSARPLFEFDDGADVDEFQLAIPERVGKQFEPEPMIQDLQWDSVKRPPPPAPRPDSLSALSAAVNGGAPEKLSKVLLIDDDANVRSILAKALRNEQLDVIEASSGKEALGLISDLQPAIIICDLVMPEMSGQEVLRRLQEGESTKAIPVVVLTSSDDEETELGLLRSGVNEFISKNASLRRIVTRVRRLIEG